MFAVRDLRFVCGSRKRCGKKSVNTMEEDEACKEMLEMKMDLMEITVDTFKRI